MDIGDDRHIVAARAQTFHDVLEIARILHRRRGDSDNFAAGVREFHRLLDRRFGVHRVAGDHRLDADRVVSADADIANLHLARGAAMVMERITAIAHENRMYEDSSNLAIALPFYGVCEFFPGDCASN